MINSIAAAAAAAATAAAASAAATAAAASIGTKIQLRAQEASDGPQSGRKGQRSGQWAGQEQGSGGRSDRWSSGTTKGDDDEVSQRAAFREASLRWHPDKFVQRFGEALAAVDRDRTLARVQAIAQELNRTWSERRE